MNFKKSGVTEVQLWGEIEEEPRNIGISEEEVRTLIRGAVKQEEPKLKLPVTEDDEDESYNLPEHLTRSNEYVIHTIKLNEHAKAVEGLIEDVIDGKTDFEECPPIPEFHEESHAMSSEDSKSKCKYVFEYGQGPELPPLDTDNINLMLQKAVLVTLAETGFDKAKKSALYVMIDVARDILTKITRMLHEFSQQDVQRDRTAYKDPLEKVLNLMGVSGVKEIHDYYLKSVIGKRDLALKRSHQLVNQYNGIVNKVREQAAIEADETSVAEFVRFKCERIAPSKLTRTGAGFTEVIPRSRKSK